MPSSPASPQTPPEDLDLAPEEYPPYVEAALLEEDRMIRQMFGEDR